MSGVDYTAIKTAIRQWVVAGSGLTASQVIWSDQRDSRGNPVPRPSGLFVSMSLMGVKSPGFDDVSTYTVDTNNIMSQTVQGPRVLILSLQVYQGSPIGGNDFDALRILTDILTATDSDDVDQLLSLAKIAVGNYDDAQLVPSKFNAAKAEARAYSTVKLHIGSSISFVQPANTGWISNVNAAGVITDELGTEAVTVFVTDT